MPPSFIAKDLLAAQTLSPENTPDYIFIELPAMLQKNHPAALLASDMNILVYPLQRIWSEADNTALAAVKSVAAENCLYPEWCGITGSGNNAGRAAQKRSVIRKRSNHFFRFQFSKTSFKQCFLKRNFTYHPWKTSFRWQVIYWLRCLA